MRRDLVVRFSGCGLVVSVHGHLLATVVCLPVPYHIIRGGRCEDGGVGGVVGGLQGRVTLLLLLLVVAVEGLLADHGQLGLGRYGKWW